MAKLIIWECDKCGKKATDDEFPSGWATAEVKLFLPNWSTKKSEMMWCSTCWRWVTERAPEEIAR
jgi:hypothetical protein